MMAPRAHSLAMLGAVLADTEVVDRASSRGDATFLSWSWSVGLISGVTAGGDETSEAGWLAWELLLLLLTLPAP